MKKPINIIFFMIAATMIIAGCKKNKEETVVPTIANEALTTVKLTLINTGAPADTQIAVWEQLLDANGNPLDVDTTNAKLVLKKNATYTCLITILDKSKNPAEDVTAEIEERANIHLFFYQPLPTGQPLIIPYNTGDVYPLPIPTPVPSSPVLNLTVNITDLDNNTPKLPVGLHSNFITGDISSGWLRLVLRHQPNGKNGSFGPGSTDLDVGYKIAITN